MGWKSVSDLVEEKATDKTPAGPVKVQMVYEFDGDQLKEVSWDVSLSRAMLKTIICDLVDTLADFSEAVGEQ